MRFVDFFAGIGGIRLGLEQAGHECVGFCEWDKYARTAYKAMYNTEGEWENHDVRTVGACDIPDADLWCFGFPCQDISVAGKQKGLQEGERSGLFYEIMRLLAGRRQEDRPRWLLVENVKNLLSIGNGFDFARLLIEVGGYGYSLQWQVLNSKDFGVPQNRERVFIVGYLGDICGREVFPLAGTDGANPCKLKKITQGVSDAQRIYESDGLARTLKSEGGWQGGKTGLYAVKVLKPYGSTGGTCSLQITENEKGIAAPCAARDYKGISRNKGDAVLVRFRYPERGEGSREKGYMEQVDCASALTSKHCGDQTADCSNGVLVAPVLTPDRKVRRQNGRWMKEPGEPSFTLTSADRHGVAIYQRPRGYNKGGMHDIAPALSINAWQENNLLADNVRIRRLTPRECWRLQGFPDEYFDKAKAAGISDTQLYKQAGNSVSVPVAKAIGERLKEIEENDV